MVIGPGASIQVTEQTAIIIDNSKSNNTPVHLINYGVICGGPYAISVESTTFSVHIANHGTIASTTGKPFYAVDGGPNFHITNQGFISYEPIGCSGIPTKGSFRDTWQKNR